MRYPHDRWRAFTRKRGAVGLALVVIGEALIIRRISPISDFTFPLLWFGYIFVLDAALAVATGSSPFETHRRFWLALFPASALVWWFFEGLNVYVHNWVYVGGKEFQQGVGYVLVASLDFSTVLPAVWTTAMVFSALFGSGSQPHLRRLPAGILVAMEGVGILCIALPVVAPSYAFGLIWGSMYFILDPINYWLGRPALIADAWNRKWRRILIFAGAALMCGFFWEAWNYWAMPKWRYVIPHVGFLHIFEMPILGWLGYPPFGLELFAFTTFLLPFFGITLPREEPAEGGAEHAAL